MSERPAPERRVGLDYDHDWSRRYPVRLARAMVLDNVTRPLARAVAPTTVLGMEHLRMAEPPVIIVANHASHIDTPLLLSPLPVGCATARWWRRRLGLLLRPPWKSSCSFALTPSPSSAQGQPALGHSWRPSCSGDGWNLVIFPEGGRSPDGWTQAFRGGAAYLPARTGRPVVPVYLTDGDVLPADIRPKGGHGIQPERECGDR